MEFSNDRVDPELGQFLLLDAASFDNKNYKDVLIAHKQSGRLVLLKNYDPVWVTVEITKEGIFSSRYEEMEESSGLPFHMYIRDWNQDGYLDIILPVEATNSITQFQNPGKDLWPHLD